MILLGSYSSPGIVTFFETVLEAMGYLSPTGTIQIGPSKIAFCSRLPFSQHETIAYVGRGSAGTPATAAATIPSLAHATVQRSFNVDIPTLLKILKPLKAFRKKKCAITIAFYANPAEDHRDTTYHICLDFSMGGGSAISTYAKTDSVRIEPGVYVPQPREITQIVESGGKSGKISMLSSTYAKFCKDLMSFPGKIVTVKITDRRIVFSLDEAVQSKRSISFFFLGHSAEDTPHCMEESVASFSVNKLHICKLSKLCGSSFTTSVSILPGDNSLVICCESRGVDLAGKSVIVANALHKENSSAGDVRMNILDISSSEEDDDGEDDGEENGEDGKDGKVGSESPVFF